MPQFTEPDYEMFPQTDPDSLPLYAEPLPEPEPEIRGRKLAVALGGLTLEVAGMWSMFNAEGTNARGVLTIGALVTCTGLAITTTTLLSDTRQQG